ncbi:MAG: signal peptidase II [Candidatus Omnitrophica bacterium CG07_land_8_20_14_0_80_50_8]|nr:MAG: signal peptidase II [Candidatus Omnitrophica bacterium CG07_land_8_20_14_0_80_50_8]
MKKFLPLSVIPFIFILDRVTKWGVLDALREGQSIPVWVGVFHFTRVNNTGAAFGILRGGAAFLALISALCVAGLFAVIIRSFFIKKPAVGLAGNLALALVVSGAAGNLYDRIRYGYVIDFLDFRIWPVFNIADSAICVGIFLIILLMIKTRKA